jgi:transposase
MIKATAHFAERAEIIESVPGLAGTTSAGLIASGLPQQVIMLPCRSLTTNS